MTDTDTSRLDRAAQIRDRRQAGTDHAQPETTPKQSSTETDDEDDPTTAQTRLLTVTIGGEDYAFDVTAVAEVIEPTSLTRVPRTPAVVAGVTDLRGRVTTVLDPATLIKPGRTPPAEQPIVVFDGDQLEQQGTVGWLIDDVGQVLTPTAADYREPPGDDEWVTRAFRGDDGGYVLVIDLPQVFDRAATAVATAFENQ